MKVKLVGLEQVQAILSLKAHPSNTGKHNLILIMPYVYLVLRELQMRAGATQSTVHQILINCLLMGQAVYTQSMAL
jgi:hypothetical protein